ncbi:MAG TPA: YicC family protein [Spirochaetales bacterium]|nr:YicC family protein [Spirochaetales bacterium]
MKSMTGFARREITAPSLRASAAIKSYNNRYLDLQVLMPPYLGALEPKIRALVSGLVVHGKVELSIRVRELSAPPSVSVDAAAAAAAAEAIRALARAAGIDEEPRLSALVGFEGVLAFERDLDSDAIWTALEPELAALLADYDRERLREGAATRQDMERQLARMEAAVLVVEREAPSIEAGTRENLLRKFREVMGDLVDENRVLAETAAYLAKHTVNEELVRLRSHVAAFRAAMGEKACGKKLDFLCQEMNREANTIGSKNAVAAVGAAVVELKDAIENIREQTRNVE